MFEVERSGRGHYRFYSDTMGAYICRGSIWHQFDPDHKVENALVAVKQDEYAPDSFDKSQCLFDIRDQRLEGMSHVIICIGASRKRN